MSTLLYPAGGLLPVGAHYEPKWNDEGFDLATNWNGIIQAPGDWECVQISQDQPFPNGFGPHYGYFRITSGPWADTTNPENSAVFYAGHDKCLVDVGQRGHFGAALALANQGFNWANTHGGWLEWGNAYNHNGLWLPGPNRPSHWFDNLIANPMKVVVPDPPIKWGDSGWRVIGLTNMLKTMGYLTHLYTSYTKPEIHWAIVTFKTKHGIKMPPAPDTRRGWVDVVTDQKMRQVRDWCVKHHRKDFV